MEARERRLPTGSMEYVSAPLPVAPLGSLVMVSLVSRDAVSYP